jgi:hypothetical protein
MVLDSDTTNFSTQEQGRFGGEEGKEETKGSVNVHTKDPFYKNKKMIEDTPSKDPQDKLGS